MTLNRFSSNTQSGIASLSGSNIILGNEASNNGANGITVSGSSNILVSNTANGNAQRGIGLGNVCTGLRESIPSGNDNKIIANTARQNAVDFFWDQHGTGNIWVSNSNDAQPVPLTPPTASLQC